jgi:hypothetical protein
VTLKKKNVPKAACDYESCSESLNVNFQWGNLTNESEEKPKEKFDAAYGTISKISKWFKKQAETLHFNNPG